MSNLPAFSITYVFNGDVAASSKVNPAALDAQLGNIATAQNQTKTVLDIITDSSNNLAGKTVGLSQLKAEVMSAMKIVGTVYDQAVLGALTVSGQLQTGSSIKKSTQSIATAAGTTVGSTLDSVIVFTGATTQTYTMPVCATGREIILINRSTGNITLNSQGADTLNGGITATLTTGQLGQFYGNATDFAGRIL